MSGIDPWTVWVMWLTAFTLIVWGMKPGGQRVHTLLIVSGNVMMLGLALLRPEVRLAALSLLIVSLAVLSNRRSARASE